MNIFLTFIYTFLFVTVMPIVLLITKEIYQVYCPRKLIIRGVGYRLTTL